MKRAHLLLAGLLASVAGVASVANAQPSPGTAQAAKAAKVQLRHTSRGKILVNGSGFTVYAFTRDPRNKDTCIGATGSEGYGSMRCEEVWPPLTTSGKPTAGAGVKSSLLSTIRLADGRKQVTYAGHALYLYKPATERGETSYVGEKQFGGTWTAVNAAGKLIR
jgi:predicted lipoprotein with Yx(FWY)xxD motif